MHISTDCFGRHQFLCTFDSMIRLAYVVLRRLLLLILVAPL